MARMHSRKKGLSGSSKPAVKSKQEWLKVKPKEVTDLIVSMKKEEASLSSIGTTLRDSYGISSVKAVTGKKVGAVVSEAGLASKYPEDLMSLMKRAVNLRKHMDINKKDLHNKHSLQLIESKIGRLVKYYRRNGKLPVDWSYSFDKAKLLVE